MWRYVGNCADGESFEIDGINVWSSEWERVVNEIADVRDPAYDRPFRFHVYCVRQGARSVKFAAGEFSNCIWGFYIFENPV